jgi:plasmid maintenance system antidote protein VapI
MTNTKLLEEAIARSGLKKGKIAEVLGVSRAGLINLINNRSEFKASQITVFSNLLGLTTEQRDAIFFAVNGG